MLRKYPSVFLLILVVAGIIVADLTRLSGWLFLFLCLLSFVIGIVILNRGYLQKSLAFFALAIFCFAGFHLSIRLYNFSPNHLSHFVSEKQTYHIFGRVADWPDLKANRTEIKIAVDSLGKDLTTPVKGSVLLKVSDTTTALQRGDRVEFRGTIYPLKSHNNPGSFDYARYLQLQGVFGIVYLPTLLDLRIDKANRFGMIRAVDRIRAGITESFKKNLSPVTAALASGFLIGETRGIPTGLYHQFRDSGTLHLLAVSGSNVALVVLFLIVILRPFALSQRKRAIVLMGGVFLFALLSYGEPSVVRASLMAGLVLLASLLERPYDLNQIIATAAATILLIDPTQLFSVGFQLSFVTAWGLIFVTPRVMKLFESVKHRSWYRWLIFPLIVSLIAQLCSMPLIAFYFGRVPAISVVANLVIVPLVSIAVVGVLLLLLADLIWPTLGLFFGAILDSYMKTVVFFLDIFGEKQTLLINTGDLSPEIVILFYFLLFLFTMSLFSKYFRRSLIFLTLALLNAGLLAGAVRAVSSEDSQCTIAAFSVPGGTAVLVWTNETGQPDLVITGSFARQYPIDERIFEPALNSLGVVSVNRLFVLSAEYGAMDDLIRLAEKLRVGNLFVDSRLQKSFADAGARSANREHPFQLHSFSTSANDMAAIGVYPSAGGILINLGTAEVLIVNQSGLENVAQRMLLKPAALIVGNDRNMGEKRYASLINSQFNPIICSRIEQSLSTLASERWQDRVYSIYSFGACRLTLSKDSNSFVVTPL